MTNGQSVTIITGGSGLAVCAEVASSPATTVIMQGVILITCVVVLAHILVNCWLDIRKAKRKKEASRGRSVKAGTP